MKKALFVIAALSAIMAFSSCSTLEETTKNVSGESYYADLVVKDYESVGMVFVESTEEIKSAGLFGENYVKGSKVTYYDLMKKAQELGADDIINVRIDRKQTLKQDGFLFFKKRTVTYNYYGSALAIKYKDAKAETNLGSQKTSNLNIDSAADTGKIRKLFKK